MKLARKTVKPMAHHLPKAKGLKINEYGERTIDDVFGPAKPKEKKQEENKDEKK